MAAEATSIQEEDQAANWAIGRHGAKLLPMEATVLTHCNAGALATAGYGTALGIVRAAWARGSLRGVVATETRPLFQGARLTAWELSQDGIPVTVVVDSAAGAMLQSGRISVVVVGADRIAANGDVANKIGTYTLAVVARANGVPFYVAAPTSTVDRFAATGADIPIEERPADEVTAPMGVQAMPPGVPVFNPAFDVTPAEYVSAIVTEAGVAWPPYREALERVAPTNA
jgi:methylthioribose-1-phosphate isomerase